MWWVIIQLLLQLISFCTCQPPSGGWYYRRRLIDYLYMTVISFCQQLVSYLSPRLYMTIGPLCRQRVSSLSSYLWYHLRVTINQPLRIVWKCWTWGQGRDVRVNLLSYISYLRDLFRRNLDEYESEGIDNRSADELTIGTDNEPDESIGEDEDTSEDAASAVPITPLGRKRSRVDAELDSNDCTDDSGSDNSSRHQPDTAIDQADDDAVEAEGGD